jgi:cyclic pyranopterin phosphate synthase
MSGSYTHFDESGRPVLVDVSSKKTTLRKATAEGWLLLPEKVFDVVSEGTVKKGDPFTASELAGIMGAKKTHELVPLCHNIRIDNVSVKCELIPEKKSVRITGTATANEVTGVEMEALTAVTTAALCFYDMCKGIDKGIVIENIRLLSKSGGKSGDWFADGGYRR